MVQLDKKGIPLKWESTIKSLLKKSSGLIQDVRKKLIVRHIALRVADNGGNSVVYEYASTRTSWIRNRPERFENDKYLKIVQLYELTNVATRANVMAAILKHLGVLVQVYHPGDTFGVLEDNPYIVKTDPYIKESLSTLYVLDPDAVEKLVDDEYRSVPDTIEKEVKRSPSILHRDGSIILQQNFTSRLPVRLGDSEETQRVQVLIYMYKNFKTLTLYPNENRFYRVSNKEFQTSAVGAIEKSLSLTELIGRDLASQYTEDLRAVNTWISSLVSDKVYILESSLDTVSAQIAKKRKALETLEATFSEIQDVLHKQGMSPENTPEDRLLGYKNLAAKNINNHILSRILKI